MSDHSMELDIVKVAASLVALICTIGLVAAGWVLPFGWAGLQQA